MFLTRRCNSRFFGNPANTLKENLEHTDSKSKILFKKWKSRVVSFSICAARDCESKRCIPCKQHAKQKQTLAFALLGKPHSQFVPGKPHSPRPATNLIVSSSHRFENSRMPNQSDALNANTMQNKNKRLDLRCLESIILNLRCPGKPHSPRPATNLIVSSSHRFEDSRMPNQSDALKQTPCKTKTNAWICVAWKASFSICAAPESLILIVPQQIRSFRVTLNPNRELRGGKKAID